MMDDDLTGPDIFNMRFNGNVWGTTDGDLADRGIGVAGLVQDTLSGVRYAPELEIYNPSSGPLWGTHYMTNFPYSHGDGTSSPVSIGKTNISIGYADRLVEHGRLRLLLSIMILIMGVRMIMIRVSLFYLPDCR